MKAWLSRAVANTVLRGDAGDRITPWSRWFRRSGPVADSNFQGPDEPYPGHWRQFPQPWPPIASTDPDVRRDLLDAVGDLPATWRAVLTRRDVAGRSDADIALQLGITGAQERSILTRARAAVRDALDGRRGR